MHDPHHADLDLDVINHDYKHGGSPPYLRFEEMRNTPFLDGDNSEYFCIIVRFTMQTGNTLPVIIPRIANPMYPNTTIDTVSYTYRNQEIANNQLFASTAPVIYEPDDNTATIKPNPTRGQNLSGKYYHVHSYIHLINMVNKALIKAFDVLIQAIPKGPHNQTTMASNQLLQPP